MMCFPDLQLVTGTLHASFALLILFFFCYGIVLCFIAYACSCCMLNY